MSPQLPEIVRGGLEHARVHDRQPLPLGGRRTAAGARPDARRALDPAAGAEQAAGQSERPYDQADLELAGELARRAALAIDNARLFSALRRVEQRLETILVNLAEAITVIDRDGQTVFANQAAADLLGVATPARADGAPPGNDHVALPRPRRAGPRARPRAHARQAPVRGRTARAAAGPATSSAPPARSAG